MTSAWPAPADNRIVAICRSAWTIKHELPKHINPRTCKAIAPASALGQVASHDTTAPSACVMSPLPLLSHSTLDHPLPLISHSHSLSHFPLAASTSLISSTEQPLNAAKWKGQTGTQAFQAHECGLMVAQPLVPNTAIISRRSRYSGHHDITV